MNPDLMISICWILVTIFAISVFYFLPSLVAWGFGKGAKKNAGAIFILNLFLGWTFIGWVIALVWAFMKDPEKS